MRRPSSSACAGGLEDGAEEFAGSLTVWISFSATRSLTEPPGSRNCAQVSAHTGEERERGDTSALPRMSHPVASERDRIRIRGVFPMHSSRPFRMSSFMAGLLRRRRSELRVWTASATVAPRATPPSTSAAREYLSMAPCFSGFPRVSRRSPIPGGFLGVSWSVVFAVWARCG